MGRAGLYREKADRFPKNEAEKKCLLASESNMQEKWRAAAVLPLSALTMQLPTSTVVARRATEFSPPSLLQR